MQNSKKLSLAIAQKMALAAQVKALEHQLNIVISIYDNHGQLIYFQRMDNTNYGSIRVSMLKAKTSASFPISSRALAEKSVNMPGNPYVSIPDIILLPGGLPILANSGIHFGGIGISGATPDLDEQCARAALAAVQTELDSL